MVKGNDLRKVKEKRMIRRLRSRPTESMGLKPKGEHKSRHNKLNKTHEPLLLNRITHIFFLFFMKLVDSVSSDNCIWCDDPICSLGNPYPLGSKMVLHKKKVSSFG